MSEKEQLHRDKLHAMREAAREHDGLSSVMEGGLSSVMEGAVNPPNDPSSWASWPGSLQRMVRPFDFTPRPIVRGHARGGVKDWPDEWVCAACAWVKPPKNGQKRLWCRKWNRTVWHKGDRMCFEETLDMKQERERLERPNESSSATRP